MDVNDAELETPQRGFGISFFVGLGRGIVGTIRKGIQRLGGSSETTADPEPTAAKAAPVPETGGDSAPVQGMPEQAAGGASVAVEVEGKTEDLAASGPARPSAREPGSNDIPVEELAEGLVNALGDGLEKVVDTSVSVYSAIASDARAGTRVAVSETVAEFVVVRGYVSWLLSRAREKAKALINADLPGKRRT